MYWPTSLRSEPRLPPYTRERPCRFPDTLAVPRQAKPKKTQLGMPRCEMGGRAAHYAPQGYATAPEFSGRLLWPRDCFRQEGQRGNLELMKFAIPAFVLFLGAVVGSTLSYGKPEYTKKEKKACTYCHVKASSKDLNDAGKYYKEHDHSLEGYQPK